MNLVILKGNVGQDPEIRATTTGSRVAKLSLATNLRWRDRAGNKQEKTSWHRLTVFGKLVDVFEQYVKKGDPILIRGRLDYSQTEHDGVTRYWTDIIVDELEMLGSGGSRSEPAPAASPSAYGGGSGYDGPDDDLPF